MPDPSAVPTAEPLRLLLLAAEAAEAEAMLRALHRGRVAVRGMYTQRPLRLSQLLGEHDCDLIVARLSAGVTAADVAAGYEALDADGAPPLIALAGPQDDPSAVAELYRVGADAVVPADEDAALIAAVQRQARLRAGAARLARLEAATLAQQTSMHTLVAAVAEPFARVREGRIEDANAAFLARFTSPDGRPPIGLPVRELVTPADRPLFDTLLGPNLLLDFNAPPPDLIRFATADGVATPWRVLVQTCGAADPACQWLLLRAPLVASGGASARAGAPDADEAPGPDTALRPGTDGLAARAAMEARLADLLDKELRVNPTFALVVLVQNDYERRRRERGMAVATAAVDRLRGAAARVAPDGALCGPITDDAVAVLIEDVDRVERSALRQRFVDGLAHLATAPAIGVVVADPGEFDAPTLLDAALADAWSMAPPPAYASEAGRPARAAAAGAATAVAAGDARRAAVVGWKTQAAAPPTELDPASEPVSTPALAPAPTPRPATADIDRMTGRMTGRNTGRDVGRDAERGPDRDQVPLETRIARALERNALRVLYQPIVSFMGDSQEHYSALLRLGELDDQLLTAAELLGPAARSGNLPAIDRWVIGKTLTDLATWRRAGHRAGFFVSLSALTLCEDDLLLFICDALREHDARGSWLTFQVQEREAVANLERFTTLREALSKLSCRVALNQFGHHPEPEKLLTEVPVHFVKFAPEFTLGLAADQDRQQRLAALARLAREHGARTIASGVEDARTLTLLWSHGIDYVQGNFLQPPSASLDPQGD